jgi:hypothetical protein
MMRGGEGRGGEVCFALLCFSAQGGLGVGVIVII